MRCARALFNSATNHLPWPPHQFPTPYEIFHVEQSASAGEIKKRYYELVKIYHPDKIHNPSVLENERFHKIVAANDLLCDKSKRSAFDRYGVGWQWAGSDRHSKVYAGQMSGSRFNQYNRQRRADHSETAPWDHFYTGNRTTNGDETRYTSNTNFIGFLVFLSAIGAVVQAARLGKASAEINERADKQHFNTARDLAESRRLARDLGKDERRRLFLAHRSGDATGYGVDSSATLTQESGFD
ncbi:putative Hsp40 co-chaperone Jid1 [Taphrina deformans PYCC 5710]|uniref:Hsp40 co-chaperone Jid1 n=1 Tax=Taphrina deformans (strain PYCC 5710 / ATCC 11124 / CBS 356.35 / IMI 108563 / JCM 9778 / NBRC 8474) TaxID=1097556 RepID=R5A1N5_TAPDE|nr:putative Hsp40 co-chaperone Jid1 [Taphrina deformans PYCC 5710]|eukprot:CCX35422.1 putative Hsp40 co-chaperone Jid1 [Taphrina deformans PYCC 5710]